MKHAMRLHSPRLSLRDKVFEGLLHDDIDVTNFVILCHLCHRRGVRALSRRYRVEHVTDDEGEIFSRKVVDLFDRWDDDKGWNFYHGRSTVEGAKKIPFPDDLPDVELGRLTRLSRYIIADSGILGYRGNKNKLRPVTVETISSICRVSPRTAFRFLAKVKEMKLVAEMVLDGETWLCMSPLYWSASDWIPVSLYICFRDQLDEYLP